MPRFTKVAEIHDILILCIGTYLSLRGKFRANNTVIYIAEIGDRFQNSALQRVTDKMPCCRRPNRVGEWYLPNNEGLVPVWGGATSFYRNRGSNGSVNLNRLHSRVLSPSGSFCCVVPDALDVDQTLCANIGKSVKYPIYRSLG